MMNNITTKIIFTFLAVLFTAEVMAQVPQGFNFQAVARDADGELIANSQLGVRVSVLQGSETGTSVYTETQTPETNGAGLFDLVIGEGESEDSFSGIDWSSANYYVKLEIDPAGGTEYEELGTTRLLSVPYALMAQNVINGSGTSTGTNLPLILAGSNGNISITLTGYEGDDNYGFLGLGNADGDTLAQVYVENRGDTASRGQVLVSDTFGRYSNVFPGGVFTGQKEGGFRSQLSPYNLYFANTDIETGAPPAWFGTLGGNGFTQILDYTDTGVYEGGILTGFWPGHPTVLLEDGSETPLVMLEGQKHEDRNIGVLTLRGTDGSEFSITSDGIGGETGGSANGEVIDSLFLSTQPEAEFQRNTDFFPGYIRNSDQDGNLAILTRTALQYANEGDPAVYNWYSKGTMQVAHADYTNGERASGLNPGYFYMDIYNNGNFYQPLELGIGNAADGGKGYLRLSSLSRLENEQEALFSIDISQDLNGNDPDGQASQIMMRGDSSPNVQMGGQTWENSDLGFLQLWGSTEDGNGWYLNNAFLGVTSNGTEEWASLSLMKTNISGQSSEDMIMLDGASGNIVSQGEVQSNGIVVQGDLNQDHYNSIANGSISGGQNSYTDGYVLNHDSNNGSLFEMYSGGSMTINISGSDGTITATSVNQTSDQRLKTNIQTLDNGLEKTIKMRGVTYNWIDDHKTQKTQTGLIAQEVEKVFPEFVHTDEKGMKSVNYAQMTAVLIEAVKELNSKIDDLEKQNEVLTAKLDKKSELEQRLAQIEKMLQIKTVTQTNNQHTVKK